MLSVEIDADIPTDLGPKATEAVAKYLLDGAQKGHSVAVHHAPVDKGTLLKHLQEGDPAMASGIGDLRVVWGVSEVPHARPMEFGTAPFTPPIGPLLSWGERVLGSRSAGAAVWHKIREEGVDAHPYMRPGRDAQIQWYKSHGIQDYLDRRLE